MQKNKKILSWLGGLAAFFLVIVFSWMTVETGVEITSHADFCIGCHTMEPMIKSYHDSVHGGQNERGVMAACTDCHVSHENIFAHFMGKAQSGTHDAWVTLTQDEANLDWQAKRENHNEYVYDSGCLTCHRNLEAVAGGGTYHKTYFEGKTGSQCVDCHAEVGHDNLNKYLLETKYKYGFER
jgi:cytochrome c-type protein NapC